MRITLLAAFVTAAVLLGAGALVMKATKDNGSKPVTNPLAAAAAQTPNAVAPGGSSSTAPAAAGPEGVPLQSGRALGPPRSPVAGESSGGIPCGSREQLSYHVHAHLTVFVNGKQRAVPLGVGIAPPRRVTQNDGGPFVSGGSCFSFLHTHATDGIIHIEAPARVNFSLGQFFDIWEQRLDRTHLGSHRGRVVAYLNGKRYSGDPRTIILTKHAQIQLQVGRPRVAPTMISFPSGL